MTIKILDNYKSGLIPDEQAIEQVNAIPKTPVRTSGAVRTYVPRSMAERVEQYRSEKQIRQEMLKRKTPFISSEISQDFYLSQGLILIGGISGKGKSTLAANMIHGYLRTKQAAPALVITNEETTEAVLNRAACVELGINFFDFQKGKLHAPAMAKVEETALKLADRVLVVDDPAFDMTVLEDVQSVLMYAAQSNAGVVILDYLQTVAVSRENPALEPVQVSKKLGLFLKDFGRKVAMPVIVFAQLKTESDNSEFKDRVENDRTMYNHCFQVIEIVPDFENLITKFKILKDRFGHCQTKVMEARYDNGIYRPML